MLYLQRKNRAAEEKRREAIATAKHIKAPARTGGDALRTLLLGWLAGTAVCYTVLPAASKELSGFSAVEGASLPLLFGVWAAAAAAVRLLCLRRDVRHGSRLAIFALTALLLGQAAVLHPQPCFLAACAVLLALSAVYALHGRNGAPSPALPAGRFPRLCGAAAALAGLACFAFLCAWGVSRVALLATPTYDFGIFAQMLEKMRQTGLPVTTLERDGLLSHFAVHFSPVLYLLLPFYCLWPAPEFLPAAQAALLASAGIPLWLLGKRLGLPPAARLGLCLALFLHPAYSAGVSYDFHENAFLAPLLLWLFWAAQRRSGPLTALFALLTAAVKEDAAVYVGVFGLYLMLLGILDRHRRWELRAGAALLAGALGWFFGVTALMSRYGSGVMRWRYANVMYPGSASLLSAGLTLLVSPVKILFECFEADRAEYVVRTMLPLLGLPLLTRRFERLSLLIPWLLINLMPDYRYQHDLFYQYSFGSLVFLLYAAALNLRDLLCALRPAHLRPLLPALAAAACAIGFFTLSWPVGREYVFDRTAWLGQARQIREQLGALPDDAAVCATTYYTAVLSDKREVYDVTYARLEHVLDCDYVVLEPRYSFLFEPWTEEGEDGAAGLSNLTNCLLSNGFVLREGANDRLAIFEKEDAKP